MPVRRGLRKRGSIALIVAAVGVLLVGAGAIEAAFAQAGPFGSRGGGAHAGGVTAWLFAKQAEFFREMSKLIRAGKSDGSAIWALLGISFMYGIFHAAGPGHGKAVISSYLVANQESWRRGIVLSFVSALLQALVAVAVVGVAAALLNATAGRICNAERVIELISYAMIALVGARLVFVKGRGLLRAVQAVARPLHAVGAAVTPPHDHGPPGLGHDGHPHSDGHHHHQHSHQDSHQHSHQHSHHDDEHASAWGHAHGPEPEELAGPGGWRRGFSAVLAVGLRPCSGAIIVLVFALAQGLFWAGIAATFVMGLGTAITVALIATIAVGFRSTASQLAASRPGYGMLALRGIEVGAALLVFCFGILLLLGYLAVERGACF